MPAENEKCLPDATGRQSFKRQMLTKMSMFSIAFLAMKSKMNQGFRPFL